MIGQGASDVINTDADGFVCESEFDHEDCSMATPFDAYLQTLITSIGDLMGKGILSSTLKGKFPQTTMWIE